MNMPGFTAQSALYQTKGHYQTVGRFGHFETCHSTPGTEEVSASRQSIVPAAFQRNTCSHAGVNQCNLNFFYDFRTCLAEAASICAVVGTLSRSPVVLFYCILGGAGACFGGNLAYYTRCIERHGCSGFTFCKTDNHCSCGFGGQECGDQCCEGREQCCSGTCCAPGAECCAGKCCSPGDQCCFGRCYPPGFPCDDPCALGGSVCGTSCCWPFEQCCSGTCCGPGSVCCAGHCCQVGAVCCADSCCQPNEQCCFNRCQPQGMPCHCPPGKACGDEYCCAEDEQCCFNRFCRPRNTPCNRSGEACTMGDPFDRRTWYTIHCEAPITNPGEEPQEVERCCPFRDCRPSTRHCCPHLPGGTTTEGCGNPMGPGGDICCEPRHCHTDVGNCGRA
jgi:hypothetical protein